MYCLTRTALYHVVLLCTAGPLKLTYVKVHNNPQLCGMVPASVRYAHGYNPANTRLGQPC